MFSACCVFHRCRRSARVRRCGAATCWPAAACTRTDCRRYPAAVGSRASSRSEEIIWCWSQRNTIWSKGTFTLWVFRSSEYYNPCWLVDVEKLCGKTLKKKKENKKVRLLLIPVQNSAKKVIRIWKTAIIKSAFELNIFSYLQMSLNLFYYFSVFAFCVMSNYFHDQDFIPKFFCTKSLLLYSWPLQLLWIFPFNDSMLGLPWEFSYRFLTRVSRSWEFTSPRGWTAAFGSAPTPSWPSSGRATKCTTSTWRTLPTLSRLGAATTSIFIRPTDAR